jgi:hypothetical protein
VAAARCREEEEEAKRPGKGVRSDFIAARCFREERERERERSRAKPRTVGGADVLDGAAWQLLVIGGPTWNGEGRTTETARAVGGRREGRVGERRAVQDCTAVAYAAGTARCCTGGRRHTGRRRATWSSGKGPAQEREAVGQRPGRHVARS